MFDEIPLKTRLRYWLERNSRALKAWAFPAVALATALFYLPVREMMIQQEARTTVTVSTLTVAYLVTLYIIGWGGGKLIDRHLKGRPWLLRQGAWVSLVVMLFVYLDLSGYGVRW